MSARESGSVGAGSESRGFLARGLAGLFLTLLLMGGSLHATPITIVGESQLLASKQLANGGIRAAGKKISAERVYAAVFTPHRDAWTPVRAATAVCILSGDCAPTVQVPEPQALLMVGSGLLSIAALVRRRLAR